MPRRLPCRAITTTRPAGLGGRMRCPSDCIRVRHRTARIGKTIGAMFVCGCSCIAIPVLAFKKAARRDGPVLPLTRSDRTDVCGRGVFCARRILPPSSGGAHLFDCGQIPCPGPPKSLSSFFGLFRDGPQKVHVRTGRTFQVVSGPFPWRLDRGLSSSCPKTPCEQIGINNIRRTESAIILFYLSDRQQIGFLRLAIKTPTRHRAAIPAPIAAPPEMLSPLAIARTRIPAR